MDNSSINIVSVQKTIPLRMVYNWFYISVYILWPLLQSYVLKVDAMGRTIFVLSVFGVLVNIKQIASTFFVKTKPACLCWVLLIAFSFVNSIIMGIPNDAVADVFIRANYFQPLCFLMVTTCSLRRCFLKTLLALFGILFVYVLMGTLFMKVGSDGEGRYQNEVLGNSLPLHCVSLFLVSLMLVKVKPLRLIIIFALILSLGVVVLAATRKAFSALTILFVFFLLSRNGKISVRTIILFVIVVAGLLYSSYLMLNYTNIGERFKSPFYYEKVIYPLSSNERLNKLFNGLLGDRSVMYYKGTLIFFEHPINGIGVCNYMHVADEPFRIHSEYIVHLCENGIIGFSLLISFYVYILKAIRKRKKNGELYYMTLGGLCALLIINFASWTYCSCFSMIIYAIIFAVIYPQLRQKSVIIYDSDSNSKTEEIIQ